MRGDRDSPEAEALYRAQAIAHVRGGWNYPDLILGDEGTLRHFIDRFRIEAHKAVAGPSPPKRPQRRAKSIEVDHEAPTSGFYLYRLWTASGRLLYVGVSATLRARLRIHRRRHGDLIDHITWEEHPDMRAVLAAELVAIRDEDPALNRAGVG